VYASITGFGQTGPAAARPGYNLIAQGMSGIMAITGMPGDPPTRLGGSIADLAASFLAFGCINAALVHRGRTGTGQYLDVNLLASVMALLPDPVAHYFDSGVRPGREGNRNPYLTPAEAFRTRDGYVTVVIMNPEQWERFCRTLGDETLRTDPRFATNEARLAHHEDMKRRVEQTLATASSGEWVTRLGAAGIAVGPVYEFDEVFADPQVRHLGVVAEIDQPDYGRLRMLDFPVRASATPAAIRRPAPRLGEHTVEVLDELGLTKDEIQRLIARGIVGVTAA
jgi:formyl-CoA transferase